MSASVLTCSANRFTTSGYGASPQAAEGKFRNPRPRPAMGFLKGLRIFWDFTFHKPKDTVPPAPTPVLALTRADLLAAPDRSLWRLGHSTLLLKLRGGFWITDPVFAERASPVQWAGPEALPCAAHPPRQSAAAAWRRPFARSLRPPRSRDGQAPGRSRRRCS